MVTWDEPEATDDNCGLSTLTQTHNPGDPFPIGTTSVTYKATDDAGHEATCQFTVTVFDPKGETDRDGDGMDDDWEIEHFGDLRWTGEEDADGDGATNLEEFTSDTEPTASDSVTARTGRMFPLHWGLSCESMSYTCLISPAHDAR